MANVVETVKNIKEASSYIAVTLGAGLTMGQLVGYVIGASGIIVAIFRCRAAWRANNIKDRELDLKEKADNFNREKWEYEKHEGKNVQKAKEKEAS